MDATNDTNRLDMLSYRRPQHAIAPPEALLIAGTMSAQLPMRELQDCCLDASRLSQGIPLR